MRYVVGDLLTGRRIQTVPVLEGPWSDVLNRAGSVSCTVTLKDPVVRKLGLAQSAIPGKAFLAAIEGDTVLQAGPIWDHDYDDDTQRLTITAAGMWAYFDHRVILPYPSADPSLPAADTRFSAIVSDPNDPGYPWPVDTRKSYQGIIRAYLALATAWPSGNVPVILPDEIAGNRERWEKGANLASVGQRLSELTGVMGGPDIRFAPRLTIDRQGIEWVVLIGTPTQPQLYAPQDVIFNVGVPKSSVSGLRYKTSGTDLGSRAYASGGRGSDTTLIASAYDSTLIDAGFPLLDLVDSTHGTVTEIDTLTGYAQETAQLGRTPLASMSFKHDVQQRPYVEAFNVGDFAAVKVRQNAYLAKGTYPMRITSRSGDAQGKKIAIELQPKVH